jgi:hypothetical protein
LGRAQNNPPPNLAVGLSVRAHREKARMGPRLVVKFSVAPKRVRQRWQRGAWNSNPTPGDQSDCLQQLIFSFWQKL